MKIVFSVLFFLFSLASMVSAEVLDVNIKGVDDGKKTSRQQDYREAVMNAKLQAIEQSGASIESITEVVNFKLKYDAIESKSSAILLPGFQIIDIGYVADGTYQIVLIGKIQMGGKTTQAREIGRDGQFIAYDNRTVLDTSTKLMWAARDNGSDINWADAKSFCDNYRGGGYKDWRMPTPEELEYLYDGSKSYKIANDVHHEIRLTELIRISAYYVWSSEVTFYDQRVSPFFIWWRTEKRRAPYGTSVDFLYGTRPSSGENATKYYRALPVRNAK
ncbi:MAG: DUF1566 domain-containing protein [Deltaproteobacteria bacterium]